MTGVRYADLVDGASVRIAAGARSVRAHGFDDREEARATLRDFHAVLDALETHTWTLITPFRLAGLPAATRDEAVVADAIAMVDGVRDLVGPDRPHPSMLDHADRDWAQAALRLRGASDLVGVHLDRWGHPRSPDTAIVLSPASRDAALTRVARQVDAVLATETALGLRCLQAGLHRTEVPRWLPDLSANRVHAQHLIAISEDQPNSGLHDGLRLIGEPIRVDDPIDRAEDLILRIRQRAWELAGRPDYSVATLRDLATSGFMLTAHAAAAHGTDLTSTPPTWGAGCGSLARALEDWRALRTDLAAYRAPGPADPDIRADVLALRGSLEGLAPLDGSEPEDPRTASLLRTAQATTAELALTGGRVFATLAQHGHLHVHARDLTLDQIGEDAQLLSARISGADAAAPPARWIATVDLWNRAAAAAGGQTESPTPGPAVEHTFAHVLTRVPDLGGARR